MMKVKSFVVIMVIMTLLVGTSMGQGECVNGACPNGQCCTKSGGCSSECVEEAEAQPSTDLPITRKVDAEGECVYGDCPNGLCCSKYGYCGSGPAYCSGNVEQNEVYHPSTDPDLPQTPP